MVTVKEIKRQEIWIYIKDISWFNKEAAKEIEEVIKVYWVNQNNITLDFDGVTSINSEGYSMLHNLVNETKMHLCKLYFASVHPDIDELISTLDLTE